MIRHLLSFVAFFTDTTIAAAPPDVPCPKGLPSCGGAGNILAENLAPAIAVFIIQLAVALSLIYILFAGLQLVLNNGDEGKVGKARMSILFSLGGLSLALISQTIYSFVATTNFGNDPTDALFGGVLQVATTVMVTVFNPIFLIVMVIAAIRMVLDRGKDEEFRKAKTMIIWAMGGAIVMNVAYALVKAVLGIFGGIAGL